VSCAAGAGHAWPGPEWKQVTDPEAAGWCTSGLGAARQYAEGIPLASFMLVEDGVVIVAWGEAERNFRSHSIRKALVGAVVGRAVDEGRISLDATLAELGIDDTRGLSAREKRARFHHLLTSTSGVYHPAAKETGQAGELRPERGAHEPGEHFYYNNWGFNAIAPIYERATGEGVIKAFERLIAGPLGMEDFDPAECWYQLEPSNSRIPAYSMRISTRDLARFGLLQARAGEWAGRPLVPDWWVRESISAQVSPAGGGAFGYLWFVYPPGSSPALPEMDARGFAATLGAGGHALAIIPELDIVMVARTDTDNGVRIDDREGLYVMELALRARRDRASAIDASDLPLRRLQADPLPGAMPAPGVPPILDADPSSFPAYAGSYASERMAVVVFIHDHRLFVRTADGSRESELFPAGPDRFYARSGNIDVRFTRDAKGEVTGLSAEMGAGTMRLDRTTDQR